MTLPSHWVDEDHDVSDEALTREIYAMSVLSTDIAYISRVRASSETLKHRGPHQPPICPMLLLVQESLGGARLGSRGGSRLGIRGGSRLGSLGGSRPGCHPDRSIQPLKSMNLASQHLAQVIVHRHTPLGPN